jgi:hypothetical protein
MPPRKKSKAPKSKKAKAKKTISQVQKVSVRVGGGGGGGGSMPAPIVYATYAPPPPTQPTQFVFDNGSPPAPVKREPAPHSSSLTGVSVSQKYPSRPQPHQHMSPLSQYLFDSAMAGAPPSLSSIYSESVKSEPRGPGGGGGGGGDGGGGPGGGGGG